MAQDYNKIRIGISQGDINGVGAEIIVKALANPDILELFTPVIFGSAEIFALTARNLHLEDFRFETITSVEEIKDGVVNIYDTGESVDDMTPGIQSEKGGHAAISALEAATAAIDSGAIDLLVTAPIDKRMVQGEAFAFPGHTEYLESRYAVEGGKALMILADGPLRVSLVTTHLPLRDVAGNITKENVASAIRNFNRALRMDFGCERPKIAVLSLNPHCGDGGVLGTEEKDFIIPAIEACRQDGILAFGPIAADGLFGSGSYMNFDGVLAMYHDQGLAPFKALAGSKGINFTAGLDIIRTSPDHGTAYDLAGSGKADETSMREAIYGAIDIARRRVAYLDASENPLAVRPQNQKNVKRGKEKAEAEEPEQELETE